MQALLIDTNSRYLKGLIDGKSDITSHSIKASINAAQRIESYDLYKVNIEIRQYKLPVIFHGFIINDEHLFISFTEIIEGNLFGGSKPYIHLKKEGEPVSNITQHFFNFFNDWFDYYWKSAKTIVTIDK
jgi:hypothetical protein